MAKYAARRNEERRRQDYIDAKEQLGKAQQMLRAARVQEATARQRLYTVSPGSPAWASEGSPVPAVSQDPSPRTVPVPSGGQWKQATDHCGRLFYDGSETHESQRGKPAELA